MPDDQPTDATGPTVPLEPSSGVETVGPEHGERGSRRLGVIAGVAVAVAALLGGGAYAAYSFLDGDGPRPEDALPASTLAVVSIDLDPHAGQKIEAIRTLRKFPALRKELGIESQDDLRKLVFDEVIKESDCDDLDYARDVEPWIGKRAAFAGVEVAGDVAPSIALQVDDREKAAAGMRKVVACTDVDDFFFAVGDDYLIASDSQEHADAIKAAGEKEPLTDSAGYQKWTDEVGDPGVLNFYVSAEAGTYIADELDSLFAGMAGRGETFAPASSTAGASAPVDDPSHAFGDLLADFGGLAGTVRFADGGMELAVADGGLLASVDGKRAPSVGDEVGRLPADTAFVLGYGISDEMVSAALDIAGGGAALDDLIQQGEAESGVDLPEDVQTLLGHAVTLSLGGAAPEDLKATTGPRDLPLGLVLHTDPDKAEEIIATAEDNLGFSLADIPVLSEKTDSMLVLSPSEEYAKELTEKGSLGRTDAFEDAVPDAADASTIVFAAINDDWRRAIVELLGAELAPGEAEKVEENLAPLRAIGLSTQLAGDGGKLKLRISTR